MIDKDSLVIMQTNKSQNFLYKSIARFKIGNRILAAHSLRFGGTIAACVDEIGPARVRGWVYDAASPVTPVNLSVVVNGRLFATLTSSNARPDLAMLTKTEGRHGFDLALPAGGWLPTDTISIHVSGKPSYVLYEGMIPSETTVQQADISRLVATLEQDIPDNVKNALRHIFLHITATHEHSLRRHDETQAFLEKILQGVPMQVTNGAARHSKDLTYMEHAAYGPQLELEAADVEEFLVKKIM